MKIENHMNKQSHLRQITILRFTWMTSILVFAYLPFVHAQDTIIKRNEEKIIAKITEVNQSEIRYKRFDYQDGPTFTIVKWEIKYIIYGNGAKESFENFSAPKAIDALTKEDLSIQPAGRFYYYKKQRLPEQSMLDIVWKLQDKKINLFINKTENSKVVKNCFFIGGILLGTAGILTFTGIISTSKPAAAVGKTAQRAAQRAARAKQQTTGTELFLSGTACELVSVIFSFKETNHAHMVVDLYNKSIQK